jgi:hypothetical protein
MPLSRCIERPQHSGQKVKIVLPQIKVVPLASNVPSARTQRVVPGPPQCACVRAWCVCVCVVCVFGGGGGFVRRTRANRLTAAHTTHARAHSQTHARMHDLNPMCVLT